MIVGVDCVMDTKGASGYANPSADPWQKDDSTVPLIGQSFTSSITFGISTGQ
jgi:hypothetical protein